MKEIIAYASKLHITILPEIDVPAHSQALIASYPQLSCTQKPYSVSVGHNSANDDNVLCVGNEEIFSKLDIIFTEIAKLFPCQYIHIGGDEADKSFWETCPKCQRRMNNEHLSNVEELQSYFVKRMEKMLNAKGKKLIGWDEILEGGLAPEATVMSWRGIKGGIEAAKQGHNVIMTPQRSCYLDLYQADPSSEPPTYGMCLLSKSYSLDPVPEGIDDSLILGGQGNLWTESVPDFRQVEYMTWPRALALSEVFWSKNENKHWNKFVDKVETEFKRFDYLHIKYASSFYTPIVTVNKKGFRDITVKLSTEIDGLDIYYSFDNITPDEYYPKYNGEVLQFPQGSSLLKVISYKNGKPVGNIVSVSKDELKERVFHPENYMW
jgi:hexosaminidase